jgi:hypothetical protein
LPRRRNVPNRAPIICKRGWILQCPGAKVHWAGARKRARSVIVKPVKRIGPRNGGNTALGPGRTGPGELGPTAGSPSAADMTTFDAAFRRIAEGAPLVMVLGGAGTGKTTFLHELRRRAGARQVFLAPTGVAALQLGARLSIPSSGTRPESLIRRSKPPTQPQPLQDRASRHRRGVDGAMTCLMLLTVACVLHATYRSVRRRSVVLVGDFLQLHPSFRMPSDMLARMDYLGPMLLTPKYSGRGGPAVHNCPRQITNFEHLTCIRNGERSPRRSRPSTSPATVHTAQSEQPILARTNARVSMPTTTLDPRTGTPERLIEAKPKANSISRTIGCRSPKPLYSRMARV